MPLLSCTARTCLYNKNEYCSKGDIQVDGPKAQKADETCCRSFVEKKEGAMNSMDTGTAVRLSRCPAKPANVPIMTVKNATLQRSPSRAQTPADVTRPCVEAFIKSKKNVRLKTIPKYSVPKRNRRSFPGLFYSWQGQPERCCPFLFIVEASGNLNGRRDPRDFLLSW